MQTRALKTFAWGKRMVKSAHTELSCLFRELEIYTLVLQYSTWITFSFYFFLHFSIALFDMKDDQKTFAY